MAVKQSVLSSEEPDICFNQVYKGDRNGELFRVVYEDPLVVVLRGEESRNGTHPHRFEDPDDFKAQIAAGRMELCPDANPDIPKGKRQEAKTQSEADTSGSTSHSNGRSVGDQNNARIEQFTTDSNSADTPNTGQDVTDNNLDSESDESATPVSWSEVDRIGEKAEANLYEAGYETPQDIHTATDAELVEVPLLSESKIENLQEYLNEQSA